MGQTDEELVCENCGLPADVCLVGAKACCPGCSSSAGGGEFTVHVRVPEGVLVTTIHQMGWRWGALREESIERWRAHEEEARRPPRGTRPWWRRLFG